MMWKFLFIMIPILGFLNCYSVIKSINQSVNPFFHSQHSLNETQIFFLIISGNRRQEAGYFHVLSQRSNINATLVEISEEMLNEDSTVPIWRAIEEIKSLKAEVILLFSSERNMGIMLQQVTQPLDLMSGYCNIQKV